MWFIMNHAFYQSLTIVTPGLHFQCTIFLWHMTSAVISGRAFILTVLQWYESALSSLCSRGFSQRPARPLTLKPTRSASHPLAQNRGLKGLEEITKRTMFHKWSAQDILYEWTPCSPPPTAVPKSHLILFLRLLFHNDKWGPAWKQPATGSSGLRLHLQSTQREALWRGESINMTETRVKPRVVQQKYILGGSLFRCLNAVRFMFS